MQIPLLSYDFVFQGLIPERRALKLERDRVALIVRKRTGHIARAGMRKRPGDPNPTTLRDHMGQAYSYRHELGDGHQPWALRPLGHRIKTDQSFEYNLAPASTRAIFLRVVLDCMSPPPAAGR